MNKFDDREKTFEKKFQIDQELKFKVEARSNKYLGEWAGSQLGKTEEEKKKHKEVVAEIESMQGEFQKEMENAISEQGLEVERYEKIAMALQTDTELQQRLQQLMQG